MSEQWDFFFCHVDDKPASIFVDLGLHDQAPIATLPHRAYLSVALHHPRDDGLSSQEEFEALKGLEDAIHQRLVSPTVMYVGRNTSDGRRDFWFYLPDGGAWEKLTEDFMARFPDYRFEADAGPDPEWEAYLDFLYPNDEGWDFITNRQVCDRLEEGGDPLTEARDIDHWAYFPDPASRDAFIARVRELGFDIRELLQPDEERAEYGVQLWRCDVPSHRAIHDITIPLLRAAREAGGDYEGWETQRLAETPAG
ncbi:DUF695 domain-containing protein [Lysobacter niastensis]|uniref:DUF695 domain-containing protein n=1 Tax=Lysobacter niastensis TaxID=380629 RepID=A0ABS0BBN0_9GAMM|nr:DUF695 domain-containing protein [Lysobacter niastensis]MBF6025146.1 DUF695 domain-containing protein [Lysobacter niastensis]